MERALVAIASWEFVAGR